MVSRKRRMLVAAVIIAASLTACLHTKVISTWRDPQHQGYPKKVLVYSLTWSTDVRLIGENMLVEQFAEHGIMAAAGHEFLAHDMVIDREAVKKVVQEQQVDTILIARPKSRKDLEHLHPGSASYQSATVYAQPEDDFYGEVSGYFYTPGSYGEEKVVWEVVLFDVKARKRTWTGMFETYVRDNRTAEVKPAVKRIMDMIIEDKMIP